MAKKTTLPKTQTVKLDNYSEIHESELKALVKKYEPMVVTEKTYKDGLKARKEIRDVRYNIQNITKNNKDLLNGAKKKLESRAEELIAIIKPVEDKIDSRIKEIEAEKERIKKEKEAERQKLQAERMAKIDKLQKGFTEEIIKASTLGKCDELKDKLLAFEVTEEEFGDLTLSCKQTISGIEFSINQARERIEKELEAEKQRKLASAKEEYKNASGEDWTGENDIEKISQETAEIIVSNKKAEIIKEYHELGGEGNVDDTMTIDQLLGFLSSLKAELAEIAKQKKQEEIERKEKLVTERFGSLVQAMIEDREWVLKMFANDFPGKAMWEISDEEFNTFKDNLVAINAEITKVDIEDAEKEIPEVEEEKTVKEPKKEKATFTGGNWTVNYSDSPIGCSVVSTEKTPASSEGELKHYKGYLVAESCTPENAKLIAAAPDLLKVCKNLSWGRSQLINAGFHVEVAELDLAIKRATE